ncbi:hypothetical protein GCM10011519_31940 [Marmoricola endophyticus]|uniref:Uncharacterized protein n=1 Tax=Marmoricola endophyticus TaxID=2040280 RepID=A0A917BSX7_9ACTN|nr:hypothetical protein GCM10011519_31940 [Marmoricola endophyticus]
MSSGVTWELRPRLLTVAMKARRLRSVSREDVNADSEEDGIGVVTYLAWRSCQVLDPSPGLTRATAGGASTRERRWSHRSRRPTGG